MKITKSCTEKKENKRAKIADYTGKDIKAEIAALRSKR